MSAGAGPLPAALIAAVLAGLAAALVLPGPPAGRLAASAAGPRLAARSPVAARGRRWAAGSAGLALALLLGWPWGAIAGPLGALAVYVGVGWLEPGAAQARRGREVADLPLACDLLAGCLASGATLLAAVEASAPALGGPLADRLAEVSARLGLGAPPAEAWAAFARVPGRGAAAREHRRALADVSRAVSAAAESGAPLSDVLAGLAEDARARALLAARLRARAVGVRAVLPLGLCFLPAFVLLGVVPLVAGMASQVFG